MEGKATQATKNEPLVSFRDADILNGENTVIYSLDMEIFPGDFVYIVGKVGTGKTSIIRTMIGENPLLKGYGKVCGHKLVGIKEKEIPYLRRKVGVVFQDFQLLMDRTVEANLEFVLKATGWKDKNEVDKRIREVLSRDIICRADPWDADSMGTNSESGLEMLRMHKHCSQFVPVTVKTE